MTARALSAGYAAIWTATLTATAVVAAGLVDADVDPPRPTLHAAPITVLELGAHNAAVALWPLALVALGWPSIPIARVAGDALIAAQLLAHGLLVGTAFGDEPGLWRYLPHLPLEWLAIAIPCAAWLTARRARERRDTNTAGLIQIAGACMATLVAAALIETYATPAR